MSGKSTIYFKMRQTEYNKSGPDQSRPLFVFQLGLEPRTPSLKGMCSTCLATETPSLVFEAAKIHFF